MEKPLWARLSRWHECPVHLDSRGRLEPLEHTNRAVPKGTAIEPNHTERSSLGSDCTRRLAGFALPCIHDIKIPLLRVDVVLQAIVLDGGIVSSLR